MALDATLWTIDRATKKIAYIGDDHTGSPNYATVIELHRWLQSLADDAFSIASSLDDLDMTTTDPSRRSTNNIITLINGYTLDETGQAASEHLYDGSIIQSGGDTIWDGIINFGNTSVEIQILLDGTVIVDDWWNANAPAGMNADAGQGISHRFMVKVRDEGVDIDGRRIIGTTRTMDTGAGVDHFTFAEFKINGTSRGNNVLALVNGDDLNSGTSETTISGWTDIDINEGLQLIDVDASTVNEEYFNKFDSIGTYSQNDYYERAKWLTRDASTSELYGLNGEVIRGITHDLAWDTEAGSPVGTISNTLAQYYIWGTNIVFSTGSGTFNVGDMIEMDTGTTYWVGRILAIDDDTGTGSLIVAIESGTVTTADTFVTSDTGVGTVNGTPTAVTGGGVLAALAIDDDTGSGNLYVQVLRGTISGTNDLLYYANDTLGAMDVANYLTQNLAANEHTISTPWIDVSTGSNIIGAYGIGFETDQIDDGDTLTALDGNQYSRPNLVTNTVGGLKSTADADYVIVADWDQDSADVGNGVGYDLNDDPVFNKLQMAINATYTSADEGTITIGHANGDDLTIPTDTPSAGWIRVIDDDGYERRLKYSSWSGVAFTIGTGWHTANDDQNDFDDVTGSGNYQATTGNGCYITYLDQEATATTHNWQSTYDANRDLVVLVRNGGSAPVKQFISEWSLTSANQTINAIKTTDV